MDWTLIGNLLLILLLVVGNAFFVGSEIALTSARRSRIKQLASTGNKSAKIVQKLHKEPERFYSVTQIGITLVSLALGAIGMVTLTQIMDPGIERLFSVFGEGQKTLQWAHTFSYILAFIIISFLHVVGGELAPKVLAFHKAVPMSLAVARIIKGLHAMLRPIIWVMNQSAKGVLWLFGQRDLAEQSEGHFSMTAEEIRTILTASEHESALDPQLNMMLRGVFDLDDHVARDAMVPRTDVEALPHTSTVDDVLALFREDHRGRYPIYETSVDNIIGVVSMKQLLHRLSSAPSAAETTQTLGLRVTDVMMDAYFIPDTMRLSTLLKDFTSNRRQMAVVLDEYGGTEGLITLEDILEEIVGDYEDELTPRHRHIKMEGKQRYIINGGVRVTELEPKLNFPFPTGDYVTLGGLINHRLGRIGSVNDIVMLEGARLQVLEKDRHQITKVLFEETPENREVEPALEPITCEKQPKRNFIGWSAKRALKDDPAGPLAGSDALESEDAVVGQVKEVDFTRKTGS
jgi:CBS domain containing-hemolysin-like protein